LSHRNSSRDVGSEILGLIVFRSHPQRKGMMVDDSDGSPTAEVNAHSHARVTPPASEVTAAREARKLRRQLERERHAAILEARRQSVSMIRTRLVTNNGHAETITDRNATRSAKFSADCATRRVRVTLDNDGTLIVTVSTLRAGEWHGESMNYDAPHAEAPRRARQPPT